MATYEVRARIAYTVQAATGAEAKALVDSKKIPDLLVKAGTRNDLVPVKMPTTVAKIAD